MLRLACALAVLAGASPATAQSRFGAYGDWIVGCDNRRDCQAMGFNGRTSSDDWVLFIARAAEGEAAPSLAISLGGHGNAAVTDGTALEVLSDGASIGRLVVGTGLVASDPERTRFEIRDDAVRQAILAAARRAGRLRLAVTGGEDVMEISFDGAAAALLFMDDRQDRAGTVTALVSRGDRPASAVPAPLALPAEPPARPDPSWPAVPSAIPEPIRQGIHPNAAVCLNIPDDQIEDPEDRNLLTECDDFETEALGRVAADLVLIEVRCVRGAYNFNSRYHLWNERTGEVAAVTLPVPEGVETGGRPDILTNAGFDAQTLTLTHFHKSRGLGDCGTAGAWRWDGSAFRLMRYQYMPECHGLVADDWLVLHRSR